MKPMVVHFDGASIKSLHPLTNVRECVAWRNNLRSKRVMIVFEEKDDKTFEVTIEGINSTELKKLSQSSWSPSEFWGIMAFQLVQEFLEDAGVVKSLRYKDEES
jgi:hypothetical protein